MTECRLSLSVMSCIHSRWICLSSVLISHTDICMISIHLGLVYQSSMNNSTGRSMHSLAARLGTFTNHWPMEHVVPAATLADRGFYYSGECR